MDDPAMPPPQPKQNHGLPGVETPLTADQVVLRLETASKRGRLAGFERVSDSSFAAAAFGKPFDKRLVGRVSRNGAEHSAVTFEARTLMKLPVIFVVVLIATVWPGVYFMDQLIPGSWGWIPTWWWYLPITALPLPWVWKKLWRTSEAAALESAREVIGKIAGEIDGRVVGGDG